MQRKRPRGYYSDTVELGANILPYRRMKKITMTKLLKYFCLIVLGFCIYSMYEKIMEASKQSEKSLADPLKENQQNGRILDNENDDDKDAVDRRVKEEINRVFEEFKQKQEIKAEIEKRKDVFHEYVDNVQKDNGDDGEADMGVYADDDANDLAQDAGGDDGADDDDDDDFNEDANDDDFLANLMNNDDGNAVDDGDEDVPDKQEENEELAVEKEIEERLAEAFKDAIHEAVDEQANVNNLAMGKIDHNNDRDVKIPDVQEIFEQRKFDFAVEKVGKQLSPLQIKHMNEKAAREALQKDHDHEFPPFVTAARQGTMNDVKQLIASIQVLLPGRRLYVYDLDLTEDQKNELTSYCHVRVHKFLADLFPEKVKDFDNMHWKPLVMQTALSEFGHMIWVNPGYRLSTQELAPVIHESHEKGVLVLGQSTSYTTYAATHPDMFKFIPINTDRLSTQPHIEIRAVLIHNTEEVHNNIMKMFTSCALEESCLAPKGAKWQCKFDLTGRKPAGCHRYDESALNILLKNWFDFNIDNFAKRNSYFKKTDPTFKPKVKVCRQMDQKRDL